mgnify:CR=1 FL=1
MTAPKMIKPDGGNLYERANNMFVKVTSQDTDGAYEVCEERCPPGFASRPHMHPQNHETFFVIKGGAKFLLGDDQYDGKKGDLFHIPPGTPHQVIAGDDGIHMLMVYSPGTTEAMFADMTDLTPEERNDWETGAAVAKKHNTIWLDDFPKQS